MIGDSAEALAKACVRLLRTPALGTCLAARAYTHGKQHFSWETIYPRLDDVLDGAMDLARR